MEPKELRIGNLVNRLGIITVIRGISIDSDGMGYIHTPMSGIITINQIETIPLTEELLVKFGFVKSHSYWRNKNISMLSFKLQRNTWFFTTGKGEGNGVALEYVHQLQNLYFALTGEELTINQL